MKTAEIKQADAPPLRAQTAVKAIAMLGLPRGTAALFGLVLLIFCNVRSDAAPVPTFEKDIRPILKAHCFECHGEGDLLKGGLDVRLRRLLLVGGDDGPALVPGKPDRSKLLKMIESGKMPKRDKKLSPAESALIRKWIATGASTARPEPTELSQGAGITEEERTFWSFQPIGTPKAPKTKASNRVRTPIDAFLIGSMAKQKLHFSPEAEKVTLLRRACFDLTGLPPRLRRESPSSGILPPTPTNNSSIDCLTQSTTANVGAGTGLMLPAMPIPTATVMLIHHAITLISTAIMSFALLMTTKPSTVLLPSKSRVMS